MTNNRSSEFSDEFLARLKEGLVCRRGDAERQAWKNVSIYFLQSTCEQRTPAFSLGYLALWVRIGFERPGLVKDVFARFQKPERAQQKLDLTLGL